VTALPDSPQGNKYTENHRSRRGIGGGVLLHYWHFGWFGAALPRHLDFGIFLEAREDPQKIIFEGDSKTTNPVVAAKKEKKLVVGFIIVTPSNNESATTKNTGKLLAISFAMGMR
jgi:hypothetical protein